MLRLSSTYPEIDLIDIVLQDKKVTNVMLNLYIDLQNEIKFSRRNPNVLAVLASV